QRLWDAGFRTLAVGMLHRDPSVVDPATPAVARDQILAGPYPPAGTAAEGREYQEATRLGFRIIGAGFTPHELVGRPLGAPLPDTAEEAGRLPLATLPERIRILADTIGALFAQDPGAKVAAHVSSLYMGHGLEWPTLNELLAQRGVATSVLQPAYRDVEVVLEPGQQDLMRLYATVRKDAFTIEVSGAGLW